MTSQKEDEQLVERVFEMKCTNKSVYVRIFAYLIFITIIFLMKILDC
jgi:hypothetical protein